MSRIIHTDKAPAALGPYSQAIETNGILYTSGQMPFVPETMQVPSDDIKEQTKQALENVKNILDAAGYKLTDVVKATVFVTDMNDFAKVNEVYAEYFSERKPARACVEVSALLKGAKVEIEVVAIK